MINLKNKTGSCQISKVVNSIQCHHFQPFPILGQGKHLFTRHNYYIPLYNLQYIMQQKMNNLDIVLLLQKIQSLHILLKNNVLSFAFFLLTSSNNLCAYIFIDTPYCQKFHRTPTIQITIQTSTQILLANTPNFNYKLNVEYLAN